MPIKKKYTPLFVLGVILLALAAAGTYFFSESLVSMVSLRTATEATLADAVNRVKTMVGISSFAAIVLILASIAVFRHARHRHRRMLERFSWFLATADQAGELVTIVTRKGKIEYVNRAVELATGYAKKELVGKRNKPWLPWYKDQQVFGDMRSLVLAGTQYRGMTWCRRKDGSAFLLKEHVTPLRERKGTITRFISTARDVTRQKQVEDRLDYLDRYDALTGIPNRRHFAELLKQELGEKRPVDWLVAVMIMDIDRFKYINDLFGPEVGDEVLQRIADILRSAVGDQDIVARLGSDEFGVIHRYEARFSDTGAVADRIRHAIAQKIIVAGQDLAATATIGIASFPDSGRDAKTLIRNADIALSRAKSMGRNSVQFYSQEMSDQIKEFYLMDKRLVGALRNSEYQLNYQPYCDLITKRVTGAEALIRWHNNDIGFISPSKFIPVLEKSGLIADVGEWVLRTACAQLGEWKRQHRTFKLAVNLSLGQFHQRNLIGMVSNVIQDTGIDPEYLALELTESVCIQDIDFTVSTLKKLKDLGVSISVDDFGTGYSSLSYIKRLPVDNLKIDMSFVRDVTRDPDAASIITAITGMARSLNLKTIAEGVESEEQRNILHLLRCDMGQGYYFSPAVPVDAFDRSFR